MSCDACTNGIIRSLGRDNDEVIEDCPYCMSWKSKQLTPGAKHYGITTAGAAVHIEAMLEAGDQWDTLTGFDRACIAEMQAFSDQCARLVDAHPNLQLPPVRG